MCQRVEEGRGIMEDDEEVGGGWDLLPATDGDAGGAATLAASPERCRYGNMRRVDENMYARVER